MGGSQPVRLILREMKNMEQDADSASQRKRMRSAPPEDNRILPAVRGGSCEQWRRFLPEVLADRKREHRRNQYLHKYCRRMQEIESFGWIKNGRFIDLPTGRRPELVHVLGSYMDNCITPLRRNVSVVLLRFGSLDEPGRARYKLLAR
jgi:hypothetical protein